MFYRCHDTASSGPPRRMHPLRVTLNTERFRPPFIRVLFWCGRYRLVAFGWFDLTTN